MMGHTPPNGPPPTIKRRARPAAEYAAKPLLFVEPHAALAADDTVTDMPAVLCRDCRHFAGSRIAYMTPGRACKLGKPCAQQQPGRLLVVDTQDPLPWRPFLPIPCCGSACFSRI